MHCTNHSASRRYSKGKDAELLSLSVKYLLELHLQEVAQRMTRRTKRDCCCCCRRWLGRWLQRVLQARERVRLGSSVLLIQRKIRGLIARNKYRRRVATGKLKAMLALKRRADRGQLKRRAHIQARIV
jgi:hypothetical protein